VIAAQQRPDHATIARFVERHQQALAGLFGEVLTSATRSLSLGLAPAASTSVKRIPTGRLQRPTATMRAMASGLWRRPVDQRVARASANLSLPP
jgi:hypothetical protein